jgi:hypothetical protein
MPEFGVIIIRNPGPNTDIEIQGLAGYEDEDCNSWDKANMIAEKARKNGDIARVLTAFDPDEGSGYTQVEMYEREDAVIAGCIPDKEGEEDES